MKKILSIIIFIIIYAFIINGEYMNKFKSIPTFKLENLKRYQNYKKNNISIEEIVRNVNLNLDYGFYNNIMDALNIDTYLVLVNKNYRLDESYVPKTLELMDYKYTAGKELYADKTAKKFFEMMSTDASTMNLNIKAMSIYRSYNYQKELYEKYLLTDDEKTVDTYSARPGHSEHQTGLSFDLFNVAKPYTEFGNTNEYKWIKLNAHKYGFIIRYTKQNEYITGYKEEPWHIRFVGINAAKYIYENNITLEEYLLNKNSLFCYES